MQRALRLILLLMIILLGSQAASCSPDDKLRGYLGHPWPSAAMSLQDFQDAYWSVFQASRPPALWASVRARGGSITPSDGDGEGGLCLVQDAGEAAGCGLRFVLKNAPAPVS